MCYAMGILMLGLSYVLQTVFFEVLTRIGVGSHVTKAALFAVCFLVYPIFLLAQTVPLISHYFTQQKLSAITGKMLCCSTAGSFFGSVFTTLVLMMTIGVHNTVILVIGLLAVAVCLLAHRRAYGSCIAALLIVGLTYAWNSNTAMRSIGVVHNNAYNTASVVAYPDGARVLSLNRSASSFYTTDATRRFPYLQTLEAQLLSPLVGQHKKILVIGAGGFTVGLEDTTNQYTYVDIDPDLQRVAETYFLPMPLGPNKQFVAMSARAYLQHTQEKFDRIIVDAYTHRLAMPMECTTREFWQAVRAHILPGGVVAANIIARPDLGDAFSIRMHNTFAAAFPAFSRIPVQRPDVSSWDTLQRYDATGYANVLYLYYAQPAAMDAAYYTDDRNRYALDTRP
jgi:predicted membrane-bound spermidine synthase